MTKEEKITEAKRLRAEGLTYKAIGERLETTHQTVMYWLDPEKGRDSRRKYREANLEKVRESVRISNRKSRASVAGRCKHTLSLSRHYAKKRGYAPCTATWEEIAAALTGHCHLCGVPESNCTRRLAMDHDHSTGDFRGWLCGTCNTAIGHLRDNPGLIVKAACYLDKSELLNALT